jgi:hypothetical protein
MPEYWLASRHLPVDLVCRSSTPLLERHAIARLTAVDSRLAMPKLAGAVLALVLALAGRAHAQLVLPDPPPQRWFALDLDFGIAYDHELTGAHYEQRVGAGLSWVRGWRFWDLLATAETLDFDRYAFGVQADVISFKTAIGGYAGPSITTHGDVDLTVGLGWNIVFVEVHALDVNRSASYMVSAVLRIPLGQIAYALWAPQPAITVPIQPPR